MKLIPTQFINPHRGGGIAELQIITSLCEFLYFQRSRVIQLKLDSQKIPYIMEMICQKYPHKSQTLRHRIFCL